MGNFDPPTVNGYTMKPQTTAETLNLPAAIDMCYGRRRNETKAQDTSFFILDEHQKKNYKRP
jgi:hypothetical protein